MADLRHYLANKRNSQGEKLIIALVALVAPEFIFVWAMRQLLMARSIAKRCQEVSSEGTARAERNRRRLRDDKRDLDELPGIERKELAHITGRTLYISQGRRWRELEQIYSDLQKNAAVTEALAIRTDSADEVENESGDEIRVSHCHPLLTSR